MQSLEVLEVVGDWGDMLEEENHPDDMLFKEEEEILLKMKTKFQLRNEELDKDLKVEIACIDGLSKVTI